MCSGVFAEREGGPGCGELSEAEWPVRSGQGYDRGWGGGRWRAASQTASGREQLFQFLIGLA